MSKAMLATTKGTNLIAKGAMMPTPGETAGASAYYGDGEARWLAYIEIGCRFTEEANR